MKVAVTGGTGFIGNHVVKALLRKGFSVVVTGTDIPKAKKYEWFEKVQFIELDISVPQSEETIKALSSADKLIHLAWQGLPNYKAAFHVDKNLPEQYDFLNVLVENGLKDITVSGTCFEYGMKNGCLSENMECFPDNAYAVAKEALRKKLLVLSEKNGVSLKWVRLFYLYGEGQSPKSLISQLHVALAANEPTFNMSGGEQERDFLPVEEAADNIIKIALQEEIEGIINCCSGKPVKVKEFVASYLKEIKKSIPLNLGFYPYTDYEPMSFWGDVKKLNTVK